MCCSWLIFPLLLKYEKRERTREEIQQLLINENNQLQMNDQTVGSGHGIHRYAIL
jgi:hypothetical protein